MKIDWPDEKPTANAGPSAVSGVVDRFGVIEAIDTVVGRIKQRTPGFGAGPSLTGNASTQLAGC